MPRGYGAGRGGYWWWHHGYRYYWPAVPQEKLAEAEAGKGAVYIGPCRCGGGPHAYYRLSDGRIVHASALPISVQAVPTEPAEDELWSELQMLRKRVEELEDLLEKKSKRTE
jgi:hypothetical protein